MIPVCDHTSASIYSCGETHQPRGNCASLRNLQPENLSLALMDRPMTVDEVALFCGVSAKTVRRAIERGDLEAARLGDHGALRVRPEAIDEWFARRSTRRAVRRASRCLRSRPWPRAAVGGASGSRLRSAWARTWACDESAAGQAQGPAWRRGALARGSRDLDVPRALDGSGQRRAPKPGVRHSRRRPRLPGLPAPCSAPRSAGRAQPRSRRPQRVRRGRLVAEPRRPAALPPHAQRLLASLEPQPAPARRAPRTAPAHDADRADAARGARGRRGRTGDGAQVAGRPAVDLRPRRAQGRADDQSGQRACASRRRSARSSSTRSASRRSRR